MRANHCSNIFGVSNNLHFTKFFAMLETQSPQGSKFIIAVLNAAPFTKIQDEASNVVDGSESWRKHHHQFSNG